MSEFLESERVSAAQAQGAVPYIIEKLGLALRKKLTDPHEPGKVKVPRYNWESSTLSHHQFRVVVSEDSTFYV